MKKRTDNKDTLRNGSQKPITLIANSYKKKTNPVIVILFKMLFAYMITGSTLMCFVDFYGIPYDFSTALQQVILFVTAFFPLFVIFKKRFILPAFAVIIGGIYFFFHDAINSAVLFMKDLLLIRINSRLLGTLQYVELSSVAFHENTQNFTAALSEAMMLITGLIALICVLCTYKKLRLIALSLLWTVLYSFAFAAERADFSVFFVILIASVTGLYAMSSANDIFIKFNSASDNRKAGSGRSGKKRPFFEKAVRSVSDHGKNYLTGGIVTSLTLACAFMINSFFPGYSYIDTQDIVDAAVKLAADIGELFSFSGGSSSDNNGIFNGYFSSDSFNISNEILLNAPPDKDGEAVLKITSDEKSGTQYLIGDIGVDFNGRSWDSIMKYCKPNSYTAGDQPIVSEAFSNEEIFQVFASFIYGRDYLSSQANNIFSYSNLNIEYLKKTDIVFKPYMPYALDYLSNDKFTFYGDSILRIADSSNWIKGFISSTIAPCNYEKIVDLLVSHNLIITDYTVFDAMRAMGYNDEYIANYLQDKKNYDEYVKSMYLTVPESEKANIQRLHSEFKDSEFYPYAYAVDFEYAFYMSVYLQNKYAYSLTTDNEPDDGNTALGKFLFDTKSGHCALYASAMTLALREYGIPARYVTGFAASKCEYDPQTKKYVYTVKENNLHAWVEAYFPNIGWIAFDPTSPYALDNDNLPADRPAQTTSRPAVTTPAATTSQTTETSLSQSTPASATSITTPSESKPSSPGINTEVDNTVIKLIIIIVLAAGILTGAAIISVNAIKDRHERRKQRFRKSEAGDAVREMYKFVMKMYACAGITPEHYELPIDFAKRADELTNAQKGVLDLYSVMPIFEKSEFSSSEITEDERDKALEFTKALYEHLLDCSGRIKRIYLKFTL